MPRPPKSNYAKSKKRFKKRPYKKRRGKGSREVMVNRMPKASHSVIAPHYYTELESSYYGSVGATGGTDTGQFAMYTNNADLPHNWAEAGTHMFTNMTGAALSPGTVGLSALNCNGYTKLIGLYQYFRVYKYSVSITCTPTSNSDIVGLSILPFSDSQFATLTGLSQQEIMSLPYSKAVMCSAGNVVTKNRVVSTTMPRTILGLTKQQYKDSDGTYGFVGSPPSTSTGVIVTYNTLDGADLGAKLFFEVKLRLWLEFFNPVSDLGVT